MGQEPVNIDELFAEIGLKLRAVRESKGLTLQQISSSTRINLAFLEKIEKGELEGLPTVTFVRGFVRNFMQILDLEDPEILDDLKRIGEAAAAAEDAAQGPGYYNALAEDDSLPIGKIVIAIIALLVIAWAGYLIYRVVADDEGAQESAEVESVETQVTQTEPAPAEREQAVEESDEAPDDLASTAEVTPAPPVEVRPGLRLMVRGLESTWVRVSVDRGQPVDVMVRAAETLEWDGNEEFRLTVGKSHGVSVYLNGEDVLMPEEPNRVIPGIVLNKLTLLRLEN